jgi:hypothetical protein
MKRIRDTLPSKTKEISVLERIKRIQSVSQTSSLMSRIKAALKPKQTTPLHKIKRVQAVAQTAENMETLRRAANAREEEIQLINDEDPCLEKTHAGRYERELGRQGDTEARQDHGPVGNRGTEPTAGRDVARGNAPNHGRHPDQNLERKLSNASRDRRHKGNLETARGRVRNNKFRRAAEGSATLAREANDMANDSPTITPPLDPNDPTWAMKALNAWSNGHRMQ